MSAMVKKVLFLSLALVLCFTFAGCAEEKPTQEEEKPTQAEEKPTQEEINQIMADSISATFTAETCRFDMDIAVETYRETEVAERPFVQEHLEKHTKHVVTSGAGAINNTNRELQMTTNGATKLCMAIMLAICSVREFETEFYIVDRWAYTKTKSWLGTDGNWTKMEFPTEIREMIWDTETNIEQARKLMEGSQVSFLRYGGVNEVDCYVFDIELSMAELVGCLSQLPADYLSQLMVMAGMGALDQFEPQMIEAILEKGWTSMKAWVAKDTNLMMKANVHMRAVDFEEKCFADMDIEVVIYDYNEPIELPPQALAAPNMPGM